MPSWADMHLPALPKPVATMVALALVLVVGLADYFTGSEISLSILYLGPVVFAGWYVGRTCAITTTIVSGAAWLAADLTAGHEYSNAAIPVWNASVRTGTFLVVALLVSTIRRMLLAEEEMADTDVLTGLANRRAFVERAQFELERARRYRRPFTVAYVDLDNFKSVNDTSGHDEGDKLLVTVAHALKINVRQTDIAGRLGGDEFAVLLVETGHAASQEAIKKVHEVLLGAMAKHDWPVTFSIGVVSFESSMDNIRDVIKLADDLMYEVKKTGKNRVEHRVWYGTMPPTDVSSGNESHR